MIKVERFINELMTSNCFIIYDDETKHCLVVDPGSQYSLFEIEFIENNQLSLDYIILTHEHSDHTWGCNALIDKYDTKVVCSVDCAYELPHSSDAYFRFYYDDPNYHYEVRKVDISVMDSDRLVWNNHSLKFIMTPGHTKGSMCFLIEQMLFTGDTIMQYKLFTNKRFGSYEQMKKSISKITSMFSNRNIVVYPGHGDMFTLAEYTKNENAS